MSVKHIFWQIVAIVLFSPVLAEKIEESPDEPKTTNLRDCRNPVPHQQSRGESLSLAPVVVLVQ